MKRLAFSPKARADLLEIGAYIGEDSPERANSFVAELEAKAGQIAEQLAADPARDDIAAGLRSAPYGRYIILFRNLEHEVRIVRVLHGARDLRRVING